MPSGVTHDRITLTCLPIVSGLTLLASQSLSITLSLAGSFLFSGLMFGPDLDIYSVQFKRWGLLRWIWRPYQKSLQHRSWFSHGPIIGTTLRLLYLSSWMVLLGSIVITVADHQGWMQWNWEIAIITTQHYAKQFSWELGAALVGLELGAMSHTLSDAVGSVWKKRRRTSR